MKGKLLLVALLLALLPWSLRSQVPLSTEWQRYIEEWAEETGSTNSDELEELLTQLLENPINLNDTASDRILLLPFVSALQWDIVKAYILQHGQMLSIYEMYLLNGFDAATLARLRPFVCVMPVENKRPLRLHDVLQEGKGSLVTGVRCSFPMAEGYRDSTYRGSPLRAYFRYQFNYRDRIQLQLSGDKDPGEQFLYGAQPDGFDHYSYHLLVNDWGPVKRMVAGRYNLQFGQGLTLWNGFAPWSSDASSEWRYGQGVKGAGAMSEYGYFNGVAVDLAMGGGWELIPFYSYVRRDATAPKKALDTTGVYQWVQSIYTDGYHRSELEAGKKNLLTEQLAGGRIQWKNPRLTVGATAYGLWFDKPIKPQRYVYNYNAFRGSRGVAAGVDASYRYRTVQLFGELSYARALDTVWEGVPWAGMAGAIFDMDADNRLAITLRNYSPVYQNLYASANGRNSHNQNERGLRMCWNSRWPLNIHTTMTADFYYFPEMKYRIYAPSNGRDFSVKAYRNMGRRHRIDLQYSNRMGKRNATVDDAKAYVQESTVLQRWSATWDWKASDELRLTTHAKAARFGCDLHETQWGWAVAQDVEYKPLWDRLPITWVGRVSLFDAGGYDARLYLAERGLQFEGGSMMMYGKGCRCYLTLHYEGNERIGGGLRVGWTHYSDRENIGTGHDQTPGNNRWECMLQLRIKMAPLSTLGY
ncbi:MAG: general secretion pathway protein GspK [Bacteroidales bacterium]|nr:general secretion pathway protein GspK [Bacteroidales bacterium]